MEVKQSLPRSIIQIIERIEALEDFSPAAVRSILRDLDITQNDISDWADFEHSNADSYGRKMIYNGGYYEIMTMSWNPGDYSSIHDHGSTQWGAVKVFGELEHATFLLRDLHLSTLSRSCLKFGSVIAVGHELIHQMGNPGKVGVQSLHVYGNVDGRNGEITADARLFEVNKRVIQRVDGGVFFHLPTQQVRREEKGLTPDFMTELRNGVEGLRRFESMKKDSISIDEGYYRELITILFSNSRIEELCEELEEQVDDAGHAIDSLYWKNLNTELIEAAKQQAVYLDSGDEHDSFGSYAQLYDEVIGKLCLDSFMRNYWDFVLKHIDVDVKSAELFSIGCGTGIIEEHLIKEQSFNKEQIYGMDLSEAMVYEARKRIHADVGNALELDPSIKKWDIAYCGLNVFQYIDQKFLADAIAQTSDILKDGAYFVGDFITSDHIRWYPNLIYSEDKKVLSFRTPRLIESNNFMYQESEIVNLRHGNGKMMLSYEGKHRRYLAPMSKVRRLFKKVFSEVSLYDAVSLEPISKNAETCSSTRYLIIAKK